MALAVVSRRGEISTSSREDQDNGGSIREKQFEDQGNDARIGNIMTRIRKGILAASRKQSEHQSSGKIRTVRTSTRQKYEHQQKLISNRKIF